MEKRNIRISKSADFGLENALAGYCRRRWSSNTLGAICREWELSEAEGRNVLYGHASKATLNKVIRHRRGGFKLGLDLLCDVAGVTLEDYVVEQAKEAERERARWEAEERRLAILASAVSRRCSLDGQAAVAPRAGRSADARLGARADVAARPSSLAEGREG